MRKRYYVAWGDFANAYTLYYCDADHPEQLLPPGAERITRKHAEQLARRERQRRRADPAFAGYASTSIRPAGDR